MESGESVIKFNKYRAYIDHIVTNHDMGGHGFKKKLAEYAGCQPAYLSQVLKGKANLSFEQAENINLFLKHNDLESEYFLLLLQCERAGTENLRERAEKRLVEIKEQHLNLKDRISEKNELSSEDQLVYYSSWVFAATHILLTIPGINTDEDVSSHLNIDVSRAREVTNFLVNCGLLKRDGLNYNVAESKVFVGQDSKMVKYHQANWRLKAINDLERSKNKGLHITSVVSVSKSDAVQIKEMLTATLEQIREIVRESKEEKVCCLNLDMFDVSY